MGKDAVPQSRPAQRNLLVGVRELLQVVIVMRQRSMVDLCGTGPQQMKDHLGIFLVVLVPRVVERLATSGRGKRGHQVKLKSLFSPPALDPTDERNCSPDWGEACNGGIRSWPEPIGFLGSWSFLTSRANGTAEDCTIHCRHHRAKYAPRSRLETRAFLSGLNFLTIRGHIR